MNEPCFEYFSMPVTGGNVIPSKPEDVANLVIFLASDGADNITGQILQIDCGQYI